METHTVTLETHEDTLVIYCHTCGKLVHSDNNGIRIIEKGDSSANHTGSNGLIMGKVSVEQ